MPVPGTSTPIPADGTALYPNPRVAKGTKNSFVDAAGTQLLTVNGERINPTADRTGVLLDDLFADKDNVLRPLASLTPNYGAEALAAAPAVYMPADGYWRDTDRVSGNAGALGVGTFSGAVPTAGGQPAGGPLTTEDLGYTATTINQYLYDLSTPFVNGSTRTYFGWAKHSLASNAVILGSNGSSWVALQLVTNRTVTLWTNTLSGAGWAAAWPNTPGGWVHWALVLREAADQALLYINGALVSQVAHTPSYGATPGVPMWSNFFGAGQGVVGGVSHVGWYAGELSAAQIAAMYAAR